MEYITNANDGVHHEFLSDTSEILEISGKIETSERYMKRNVCVMEYITQISDTSEISVISQVFLTVDGVHTLCRIGC